MEIHHHPHVEKKNFKEYLLEGLMIFLAVSMGFTAESIRERLVEKERDRFHDKKILNCYAPFLKFLDDFLDARRS